ncbi:MAG: NAD+ synthase [Candidatus Dormibacteraeota bacterium]|uniref:NH(3)-dependent NAD(+) synthetase n=1 Tax=Candidatus Aeolococcus gillhamiae TaxID=3127015 RepID=A0A2W5Z5L1_9BACT|nr:NAD+ synthase [Candidatus Dormibacteraeota bacterium]PZR78135.1 MAG: NAD(+) synthetase [Candidatus Dormibacter sp. RRmetagenome_bin12]
MTSTTHRQTVSDSDALAIDRDVVRDILVGFIRNEVRKVGFQRVVVGLSGGVDSALSAALACAALGAENVLPILMPYRTSSAASEADARLVCKRLAMTPTVVDISPQVDAYFERFPDADRGRRGNKMARERMTILYDMSWAHRALVIGTSNKTELLLGYSTLFGDMASALNPLGDLYKTQVFALARSVDLPEQVISKAPSADLWEGQSDEEELGFAYDLVDSVLYHMVDERRTRAELRALGFEDAFVELVAQRVRGSQYKRRPPIIAKLSARTIDRDFRYPRDWGT